MLKFVSLLLHARLLSQASRTAAERRRQLKKIAALCVGAASASLCIVLTGCAAAGVPAPVPTTTTSTATPTTPSAPASAAPAAPAKPKYVSVTNFGASITCGYYATPVGNETGKIHSTHGYAGLFDSYLANLDGSTAQNLCNSGDMASDTVRSWVMGNTTPALGKQQLYTFLVGTNDVTVCGAAVGCVSNYINAMTAAMAWLALPASDKVTGSSLSTSAAWTPDLTVGVATTSANASISFPVTQTVSGRTLYIAYRVFDAGKVNPGTATVQLDGNDVATLSTLVNSGHVIATQNGANDTIWAVGIPLGAAGAHTVTITNGPSGGFFSFQWAGVSSGQYVSSTAGAPRVMVALLPYTSNTSWNALEATQNDALNDVITALDNDGMWVTVVHCESVLSITTDLYDTIHPNDSGHSKIATVFENAL